MAAKISRGRALSPNHERQVRLLLRLLESHRPLTAVEIYESVDQYRERFDPDGDKSSLEKMFERDREALSHTGIEIGTIPEPTAPGDRARWRYQVVQDAAGGASFDLTAEEVLLVNEATAAWLDPQLRSSARQTFVKMLGQAESGGVAPPSAPRIVVSTPPLFGAIRDAVANRHRIEFDYLKVGGSAAEHRDVDAITLFSHRGRWLLHGFDQARRAPRNFLLKRILSDVTITGSHDREAVSVISLKNRLDEVAEANAVTVLVKAQSEADARLRSRVQKSAPADSEGVAAGQWRKLVIHDWDLGLLSDELAGLGTMVRIVDPPEVVDGVRERLERMVSCHLDPEQAHE